MKYIIQDWASNTLQYNGKFNLGAYGSDLGSPLVFASFEDACEYVDTYLDEYREDIYIEEA